GPASTGRRVMTYVGSVAGSNVKPNGLYGLVTSTLMKSMRLPLPACGPMNSGSGAAWFTDCRLRNDALPRMLTSGRSLYVTELNAPRRCDGVSTRLYGEKLKRSIAVKSW